MSSTVNSFKVSHNPINEKDTWTNGDFVSGQINLELAKECQVESLYVKFKGKANVKWTEKRGKVTHYFHSQDEYFSLKQFFIREQKDQEDDGHPLLMDECGKPYSNVLAPGSHVFPFTFQFPTDQEMPPTFYGEGGTGKITYFLEAHLSRSMRLDSKDTSKLTYIPPYSVNTNPELMIPQHDTKEKKMKLFTSGMVAMDVNLDKMGYCQGEWIKVVAAIQNNSSRDIKPKYCLYTKHSFFAQGRRRVHTRDLLKEVGDVIPPSVHQTVTRTITIPPDMEPSIHNCSILKAEHRLRVYLDVKYATDPHIKFPIVILPAPGALAGAPPGAPAGALAGASALDRPPSYSAFGSEPFGVPGGPPAYRAQPAFGAPGGQPTFGAPGSQPAFGAPGAQPAFGAPGAQPDFLALGSQPAFGAPGGQPSFGAPGAQPDFLAPGAQPASGATRIRGTRGPTSIWGPRSPASSWGPRGRTSIWDPQQPSGDAPPPPSGDAPPPPYDSLGLYPTLAELNLNK